MGGDLSQRLVPDDLWALVEPVLPSFRSRPQGGGTAPVDQRAVFTAVVYVLTSGCAWRYLPPTFGVSPATAHRRFSVWTASGVWRSLHRVILDEIGARSGLDWSSVIVDAASVRAKKGGSLAGPNPVDRGKAGSKLHVLTDAQGLPMVVGVSAANVNDVQALGPLVLGIPAVRSRRGPRRQRPEKVRADKAYHSAGNLAWLRERNITPRIARPGVESSERLGRHRWKIERSISWLFGYRRLTVRYERKGSHFLAFLGLAAAMTCYKKLAKITT
ncbi:IS5 family transposase [Streptomyces sp. st140]|uniref:IS5 family transposase n=1 Tax=Streptomyces sp. st140 TaxID=1828052 RepID=UPI000BF13378|nr:IS5 family transposase [Streptomyces sp. st140]